MRAYLVVVVFALAVIGSVGWLISQMDWSTQDYSADPDTSLVVDNQVIPCEELMDHTCDRNDQRLVESAQPRIDSFLATPNLATLIKSGEISKLSATTLGMRVCGNMFWARSSATYAHTRRDMPYTTAFQLWSSATQSLCPTTLS